MTYLPFVTWTIGPLLAGCLSASPKPAAPWGGPTSAPREAVPAEGTTEGTEDTTDSTSSVSPEERELKTRCGQGAPEACARLAAILHRLQRYDEVASPAQRGCNLGSLPACFFLAGSFLGGHGVERDALRAAKLLAPVCAGNVPLACGLLARMYYVGEGVERSPEQAVSLARQGCHENDLVSCDFLGRLYSRGEIVPFDETQAASLLLRACRGGFEQGCLGYAGLVLTANRTIAPVERAGELFSRACESGDPRGCCGLGLLHRYGQGVAQDEERSRTFLQQACQADEQAACTRLNEPSIAPITYRAVVRRVEGSPPVRRGATCQVSVSPSWECTAPNCRIQVICGDRIIYGRNRAVGFNDCRLDVGDPDRLTAVDTDIEGDPELNLDTGARRLTIADGRESTRWTVDFALSTD